MASESDTQRAYFEKDVLDGISSLKNILSTEGVDDEVRSVFTLFLDLILPPAHSPNADVFPPPEEMRQQVLDLVARFCENKEAIAKECAGFVEFAKSNYTPSDHIMENRLDVTFLLEQSDDQKPVVSHECQGIISKLYTIILPPPDPDLEVNKSLVENLSVAIQFLDELEDGLSITNECKDVIRELLTLISPPSATHIKDTCSVCFSDEYGTYHRTGFKCLRCFGVRDTQEESSTGEASQKKEEMSRLALRRHLALQPEKEAAKYEGVTKSLESIDTPMFVDTVTKAQQVLICNDPTRYDQKGFDYSDIVHEAAATLGVLEGRLTKKYDPTSRSVMIDGPAGLTEGVGLLREPPAAGHLPGKYLSTRTEGFHFSLTESFRTCVRTLSHPNLLYLFSVAVGTRQGSGDVTENECVWYIHENLPLLVEHLEENEKFMHIDVHDKPTESPQIALRLRKQSIASNGQVTLGASFSTAAGEGSSASGVQGVPNTSESIEEIKAVMFSVFSATNALHERGIAHGDLRPHNLFRDPVNNIIKVRFAPNYSRLPEPFCPPEYPPSADGDDFMPTLPGDIFTLGMTLRLLVFGTRDGNWDGASYLPAEERTVWDFISRLTASNPDDRPTSASLMNDTFLAVVRIAQGVPVACRVSSIADESLKEKDGAYFINRSNRDAVKQLATFIKGKGKDFQVIRKGDSVTLYSTKNDPRQQDIARQRSKTAVDVE